MKKTKLCKQCQQEKLTTEFYLQHPKKSQRLKSKCKECITTNKRRRYREDEVFRQRIKEDSLRWSMSERGRLLRKISDHKRIKTEKYKQYHKWWAKNTEKGKALSKKLRKRWLQTPNGKEYALRKAHKRRVKFKEIKIHFTSEYWQDILKKQNNECLMCGIKFTENNPPTRDHIKPIYLGGEHTKNNIQALCRKCNGVKGCKYD